MKSFERKSFSLQCGEMNESKQQCYSSLDNEIWLRQLCGSLGMQMYE